MFDHEAKERRRNGQIMRRPLRFAELPSQGLKSGRVRIIAINVSQQVNKLAESCGINPAVFFQAVVSAGPELVEVPTRFRDSYDRDFEMTALDNCLKRREAFLVGQITCGPEEDQCI